jgi:hypothetical protein
MNLARTGWRLGAKMVLSMSNCGRKKKIRALQKPTGKVVPTVVCRFLTWIGD